MFTFQLQYFEQENQTLCRVLTYSDKLKHDRCGIVQKRTSTRSWSQSKFSHNWWLLVVIFNFRCN